MTKNTVNTQTLVNITKQNSANLNNQLRASALIASRFISFASNADISDSLQ